MISIAFFFSTLCRQIGTAAGMGFTVTVLSIIYIVLAPSFWYKIYVDTEASTSNNPVAGYTFVWILGMFFPFFNYSQLYIDVTARSSGSTDPVTGRFVEGFGFSFTDLYRYPLVGGTSYGNLVPMPNTHLMFLIMDTIVWAILAWYMDHILPDAYGYRHPLLFFLDRHFWGGRPASRNATRRFNYEGSSNRVTDDEDVVRERDYALNLTMPIALRIVNLTKRYKNGLLKQTTNLAVDHMCLTLERGQL
jgi:hypothetical protein